MTRKQLIEIIKHTIAAGAAGQRASRLGRQVRKRLHIAACDDNRPCAECTRWHQSNDANRAAERSRLRDLYLAYAYLRGVPYAVVEQKCRTAPNAWGPGRAIWDLLEAKPAQQPLHEDVRAWLTGAPPTWPLEAKAVVLLARVRPEEAA